MYKYTTADIESNFTDDIKRDIVTQNLSYADIDGIADLIGYNITIFRRKTVSVVAAISIMDIDNSYLLNISDIVLKSINFPIGIGDSFSDMINAFGYNYKVDDVLIDTFRYMYTVIGKYWLSVSISNDKVVGIEIIFDDEMIKDVIEVRYKYCKI